MAHVHRAQLAVAVYGTVSMAVVVVAWEPGGDPWELAVLAVGYALAIWLAHSFANVVSRGAEASWRAALAHEQPVMVSAVPVVVVGLLGQLFDWRAGTVEVLALVGLVLLRTAPAHDRRLGSTLVLDIVAFVLIVVLLVAVH